MYNYKSCVNIIPDLLTKRQITTAASLPAAYSNISINSCVITPDAFGVFAVNNCGIQNYDPMTGLATTYNIYKKTSSNIFPHNSCIINSTDSINVAANSLNEKNDLILVNMRNDIAKLKTNIAMLQNNISLMTRNLQNSKQQYMTQSNICAGYVDQIKTYRQQIPSIAEQANINCKNIVDITCQINNCLPLGNAWVDLCNSINYIIIYNKEFNSYIDVNYPKQYIHGVNNNIQDAASLQIPYGIEARLYEDMDFFGYSWIIKSTELDYTARIYGTDVPNLSEASYQHITRYYNKRTNIETQKIYPNQWIRNINSARVERFQNLVFNFNPAEKIAGINYSGWNFNM